MVLRDLQHVFLAGTENPALLGSSSPLFVLFAVFFFPTYPFMIASA